MSTVFNKAQQECLNSNTTVLYIPLFKKKIGNSHFVWSLSVDIHTFCCDYEWNHWWISFFVSQDGILLVLLYVVLKSWANFEHLPVQRSLHGPAAVCTPTYYCKKLTLKSFLIITNLLATFLAYLQPPVQPPRQSSSSSTHSPLVFSSHG